MIWLTHVRISSVAYKRANTLLVYEEGPGVGNETRVLLDGRSVERAGVFPYSFEPGTPATRLDGHLPQEVKSQRQQRLMEAQQEVAFDWSRKQVGRELGAPAIQSRAATP